MDYSKAGGRGLATIAFVVFTGAAGAILLNDVLGGAPFTLKHIITCAVFAGTLMVGHLASEARRGRRYLAMIGFSFLFLVGTALIVFSSVGRQGETLALSSAQAAAAEEARTDAKTGLKRAQGMLAQAQAELGRECKSGRGKRCDGIQRTIDVYEAAARGEQAKLDKIGPAKPVSPEAERLAEIAGVFGANKEQVKAGAILVHPLLVTLFLEYGGILCGGFAFRGGKRKPNTVKPKPNTVTEVANDTDLPSDEELVTIKKQFFTETPKQVVARSMPALSSKGLLGRNMGMMRLN